MNSFGDFLYKLRKEKGMTQAELAELLNVTNKAVSKWETGDAMPETAQLLPIAKIFGVSVDELLEGKRKTEPEEREAPQAYKEESCVKEEMKQHLFTRGREDEQNKTLLEKICGAVCASLMSAAIIAYLLVGILANLWHPCWIIMSTAGLSCGIIGIVFDLCNPVKRNKKIEKGENPYSGCVCGIVMLACIITYLFLGALLNLWHPTWVIVAGGALACGVIAPVFEIVSHKK